MEYCSILVGVEVIGMLLYVVVCDLLPMGDQTGGSAFKIDEWHTANFSYYSFSGMFWGIWHDLVAVQLLVIKTFNEGGQMYLGYVISMFSSLKNLINWQGLYTCLDQLVSGFSD